MPESSESSESSDRTFDHAYDVVVVGSGGAGFATAMGAADEGLSVVMLESTGKWGGSTATSAAATPPPTATTATRPYAPTPAWGRWRRDRSWPSRSSSVMGRTYPGPGSTIGPATVFGLRAARFMARDKA